MRPRWLSRDSEASATFWSMPMSMTSPCWRRSSGTSAIPAAIAERGVAVGQALAVEADRPVRARSMPKIARATSDASGADEAGQRDDLAGADGEGHVVEDAGAGEVLDLEHDVARVRLGLGEQRVEVTADHRADDVVDRQVLDRRRYGRSGRRA